MLSQLDLIGYSGPAKFRLMANEPGDEGVGYSGAAKPSDDIHKPQPTTQDKKFLQSVVGIFSKYQPLLEELFEREEGLDKFRLKKVLGEFDDEMMDLLSELEPIAANSRTLSDLSNLLFSRLNMHMTFIRYLDFAKTDQEDEMYRAVVLNGLACKAFDIALYAQEFDASFIEVIEKTPPLYVQAEDSGFDAGCLFVEQVYILDFIASLDFGAKASYQSTLNSDGVKVADMNTDELECNVNYLKQKLVSMQSYFTGPFAQVLNAFRITQKLKLAALRPGATLQNIDSYNSATRKLIGQIMTLPKPLGIYTYHAINPFFLQGSDRN